MLLRTYFTIEIAQYEADQLVFTDESYVDKRNTSRLTGWSKAGTRACSTAPFRRGRRYVLLHLGHTAAVIDDSQVLSFASTFLRRNN
jgi:hypothetical protein